MNPSGKTVIGVRYIFCAVILLLSLLLLGAGRFREDLTNRRIRAMQIKKACREVVMELKSGIPDENRNAWAKLIRTDPELFVRVCSTDMKEQ